MRIRHMNEVLILCVMLNLPGCTGEYYSDAPVAQINEQRSPQPVTNADTLMLDLRASVIEWKGTKLWGRGMHTGTVDIKDGFLLMKNRRLAGGSLVADMTAIGITDIPPDQPEPIQLLTSHLEDPVFFDVEKYPEASFKFTGVSYHSDSTLTINGHLTIKDVTRNITVPAVADTSIPGFTSRFRFDRYEWNIAYSGGFGSDYFSPRNFVDTYIEMTIRLVPEHKNERFLKQVVYD